MSRVPATRFSYWRIVEIIARRKVAFVLTLAVTLVAAGIYYHTAPRIYRATALVTVSTAAQHQSDSGPSATFLRAQAEHITSGSVLALTLADPEIKHLKTLAQQINRLDILREHVSTDVARTDGAIAVSYDAPYQDDAPIIANAIVQAYQKYQSQPGHRSDGDVVANYQQQIDKLQADLDGKIAKMEEFESSYGVLSAGDSSQSPEARRLSDLETQLSGAQDDVLKSQSDYDAALQALPKDAKGKPSDVANGLSVIVSPDQEEKLRMQLIELESKRDAMRQQYLPGHPELIAVGREIDATQRELAAAILGRLQYDQRRVTQLQEQCKQQQQQLITLGAKTAEYLRLKDDATRTRGLIDNLQSRMSAIQDTRMAELVNVEITDPADAVVVQWPRRIPVAAIALVAGLLLATGVAALRDRTDDRLPTVDAIRRATGLPVLGAVPQMPWVISLTVAAQKVSLDPTSDVAAAYRAIRAALDAIAPRNRYRSILISSPEVGDGKTTSASNLAIALAQNEKRVLLIDGSLQTPMLHTVFGVSPNSGLSTVLNGQTESAEKAIRRTSINGLWVLPAGLTPHDSAEALNDPAFPELLERMTDKYDHVIIDAPALAGDVADARIIAASVDFCLLVLRADTTTRRQTLSARDALQSVGATVQGIILTHAPREMQTGTVAPTEIRSKPAALPGGEEEDIIDIGASH